MKKQDRIRLDKIVRKLLDEIGARHTYDNWFIVDTKGGMMVLNIDFLDPHKDHRSMLGAWCRFQDQNMAARELPYLDFNRWSGKYNCHISHAVSLVDAVELIRFHIGRAAPKNWIRVS